MEFWWMSKSLYDSYLYIGFFSSDFTPHRYIWGMHGFDENKIYKFCWGQKPYPASLSNYGPSPGASHSVGM